MNIGYILLAIAVAELYLGVWFLIRYQKSPATVFFGLFAIGSAIYVAANGLGYVLDNLFIGDKIGWAGGVIATACFLPFSLSYPISRHSWRELWQLALWPVAIFVPAVLLTNAVVQRQATYHYAEGYKTSPGELFGLLLTFVGVYWIWSVTSLIVHRRKSDGSHRRNLSVVLGGVLASLAVTTAFDIILPLVTKSHFGYIGSLFTSFWVGATGYIILKK